MEKVVISIVYIEHKKGSFIDHGKVCIHIEHGNFFMLQKKKNMFLINI